MCHLGWQSLFRGAQAIVKFERLGADGDRPRAVLPDLLRMHTQL